MTNPSIEKKSHNSVDEYTDRGVLGAIDMTRDLLSPIEQAKHFSQKDKESAQALLDATSSQEALQKAIALSKSADATQAEKNQAQLAMMNIVSQEIIKHDKEKDQTGKENRSSMWSSFLQSPVSGIGGALLGGYAAYKLYQKAQGGWNWLWGKEKQDEKKEENKANKEQKDDEKQSEKQEEESSTSWFPSWKKLAGFGLMGAGSYYVLHKSFSHKPSQAIVDDYVASTVASGSASTEKIDQNSTTSSNTQAPNTPTQEPDSQSNLVNDIPEDEKNGTERSDVLPDGDVSFDDLDDTESQDDAFDQWQENNDLKNTIENQLSQIDETYETYKSVVEKYSVSSIPDPQKAAQELEQAMFGTQEKPGFFSLISQTKENLLQYHPRNLGEASAQKGWVKTLDDRLLESAESVFHLNKNLQNSFFSTGIYMQFVQRILSKNYEKTKEIVLPTPPSIDQVRTEIENNASKQEKQYIDEYFATMEDKGISLEQTLATLMNRPNDHRHPAYDIFEKYLGGLTEKYNTQLHDGLEALYNMSDNLHMSQQEKTALDKIVDLHGAGGWFDVSEENKNYILSVTGGAIVIIAGVAVTVGTLGAGSGVGGVLISAGAGGLSSMLASKLTTGLTTGVDTNSREDMINFGVGAAQMGVMRHFWKARQLLQIPYGYSLAHAASRNLLLQEGFAYVGVGMAHEGFMSWEDGREYHAWSSFQSNLAWGLLPLFVPGLMQGAKSVGNVARKFLGPSESFAQQIKKDIEHIKRLKARGKDPTKAMKKLQKKLANAKNAYDKQMITAIEKTEHTIHDLQQQEAKLLQQQSAGKHVDAELKQVQQSLQTQKESLESMKAIQRESVRTMHQDMTYTVLDDNTNTLQGLKQGEEVVIGDMRVQKNADASFSVIDTKNAKTVQYTNSANVLDAIKNQYTKHPELLSKSWIQSLEKRGMDPKIVAGFDGKTMHIGQEEFTFKVQSNTTDQWKLSVIDAEGKALSPSQMTEVSDKIWSQITTQMTDDYAKFSRHIYSIDMPLSSKLPIDLLKKFFTTENGKQLYKKLVSDTPTGVKPLDFLHRRSIGNFFKAVDELIKAKGVSASVDGFVSVLAGKTPQHRLISGISAMTLLSSDQPLMEYLQYRVLGIFELIPILSPIVGEYIHDWRYSGTIPLSDSQE